MAVDIVVATPTTATAATTTPGNTVPDLMETGAATDITTVAAAEIADSTNTGYTGFGNGRTGGNNNNINYNNSGASGNYHQSGSGNHGYGGGNGNGGGGNNSNSNYNNSGYGGGNGNGGGRDNGPGGWLRPTELGARIRDVEQRTQNSENNSIGETDRQARQHGGQHEVEDTPMVTRIQPSPLLTRPPIQRQDEYTDQEQAGRTRLASNKRGRSQDRDGNGEEEPQSGYRRY